MIWLLLIVAVAFAIVCFPSWGLQWPVALHLFLHMRIFFLSPDIVSYNTAINSCSKGAGWKQVLQVFQSQHLGLRPNLVSYSILISSFNKATRWFDALRVFDMMIGREFCPDAVCYAGAITSHERSSNWEAALRVFMEISARKMVPNVVCYSALMSSFEKGMQWQSSLELFEQMTKSRVVPDVVCYSALLSSFEKGSQWHWSLHFFDVATESRVRPNAISYHAVISSCEKSQKWQVAQHFFLIMRNKLVKQNVVSYNVFLPQMTTFRMSFLGFLCAIYEGKWVPNNIHPSFWGLVYLRFGWARFQKQPSERISEMRLSDESLPYMIWFFTIPTLTFFSVEGHNDPNPSLNYWRLWPVPMRSAPYGRILSPWWVYILRDANIDWSPMSSPWMRWWVHLKKVHSGSWLCNRSLQPVI